MHKLTIAFTLILLCLTACGETTLPVNIEDGITFTPVPTATLIPTKAPPPTPEPPSIEEPFPEKEPPEVPTNPFAPISEQGRQLADEFLSQFVTIFNSPVTVQYEYNRATPGYIYVEIDENYPRENGIVPDIYYGLTGELDEWGNQEEAYFDEKGKKIEEAIWMRQVDYASGYALLSLDDSGIPVVLIYFTERNGSGDSGIYTELYRFVDGKYKLTKNDWSKGGELTNAWNQMTFYYDAEGNLYLSVWSYHEYAAILTVTFDGTMAEMSVIATRDDDENYNLLWTNHITGEKNIKDEIDEWFFRNWDAERVILIPGTDTALALVMPIVSIGVTW